MNMIGSRFYDECADQYTANNAGDIEPYTSCSYLNVKNVKYDPPNFINAALAGIGDGENGGGPIWAIFDADAVAREGWYPAPPHVDVDEGFFFSAQNLQELAAGIVMKYQRVPMPPKNLDGDRGQVQFFCRSRERRRFWQACPEVQDRPAPVLRSLGNARSPRYPGRPQDQREMPGPGHVW